MTKETKNAGSPDDQAPHGEQKTLRELILEKISRNPKWHNTTKEGQAFIIGEARKYQGTPTGGDAISREDNDNRW
jgi:hypothetical protein